MFKSLPISLKTEVWDRIDNYLNEYAQTHRDFLPNRAVFIEEAVVAYLDLKEGGGSSGEEESTEDTDLDLDLDTDSESTDEESSSDELDLDLDLDLDTDSEESSEE